MAKKITRIDSTKKMRYYAFEYPITKGDRQGRYRGIPRKIGKDYCTRETKIVPSAKFIKEKYPNKFKNTCLIGYTYNEVENGRVSNLEYVIAKYPLHEWKINEPEVDTFLSERGIHNKLYNLFKRTGCYLCPKQNITSYYNLWKHYPSLFNKMKEWEAKARELNCVNQTFRIGETLEQLEKRFTEQTNPMFEFEPLQESETCFCLR